MNKFISFLLTITAIIAVYWTNYKWGWLQDQNWIIPVAVLLTLITGLLLKQKTGYNNLAWGLIVGSMACYVLLASKIIWIFIFVAGM